MQNNFHNIENEGDNFELLLKFENFIKENDNSYFDIEEITTIYEYYSNKKEYELSELALNKGLKIHPNSDELKLLYANLLMDKKEHLSAIKYYKELLITEPKDIDINTDLGITLLRVKNINEALKYFYVAINESEKEDVENLLVEISYNLNKEGFFDEVQNIILPILEKYQSENLIFELAYSLEQSNKLEESVKYYKQVIDKSTYHSKAWFNLGLAYNKLKRFEDALLSFDMAITIDKTMYEVYYNKANIFAVIKDYNRAISNYCEYLSFTKKKHIVYYYLGNCHENLNNLEYAIDFYHMAAQKESLTFEAYSDLAHVYYKIKEYKSSIKTCSIALLINEENSNLWHLMAKSYDKMGNKERTKRCLKHAAIYNQDGISVWIDLYKFLLENEKNFNSNEFISELKSINNLHAPTYYLAAVIAFNQGNKNEAFNNIVLAIKLKKEYLIEILNEFPILLSYHPIINFINKLENKD